MRDFTWYVAAPYIHRTQVQEHITKIHTAGWKTNSRWAEEDLSSECLKNRAMIDVEGVINADGLIYVNSALSEGKATELGIAIALLKPIIIVGERSYTERSNNNIFLNLSIPVFPTIEQMLEWLAGEGQHHIAWVQEQRRRAFRLGAMQLHNESRAMDQDTLMTMELPRE